MFPFVKVGEGPGDLENAVVGTGGEVELGHGLFEKVGGLPVEATVGTDLPGRQGGIATLGLILMKAFRLPFPGGEDALADGPGMFPGRG